MAPAPVRPRQPRRPIPWAELLKRTFQTDVLTCPRCKGTRRLKIFDKSLIYMKDAYVD